MRVKDSRAQSLYFVCSEPAAPAAEAEAQPSAQETPAAAEPG